MAISDWKISGLDVYSNSGYGYDDASLLAEQWEISVEEAKHVIGYKIVHQIEHLLPEEISPDVKVMEVCDEGDELDHGLSQLEQYNAYIKSDYVYDDALLLSELWNIPIIDAKKVIGYKIIHGYEDSLPAKVRGVDESNAEDWDNKALATFDGSIYSYGDAELLAQLWSISIDEAKKVIGYKVIDGLEHLLPPELKHENKITVSDELKAFHAFVDGGYSFADAMVLADLWGVSIEEAKTSIGYKVLDGIEDNLPAKIQHSSSC